MNEPEENNNKEPLSLDELGLNELGDETFQEIPDTDKPAVINTTDPQNDSLQIETPDGFKFSASSIRVDVFCLANLFFQVYENTKGTIKKKNGGNYLG